jgi:hypothetical protein
VHGEPCKNGEPILGLNEIPIPTPMCGLRQVNTFNVVNRELYYKTERFTTRQSILELDDDLYFIG